MRFLYVECGETFLVSASLLSIFPCNWGREAISGPVSFIQDDSVELFKKMICYKQSPVKINYNPKLFLHLLTTLSKILKNNNQIYSCLSKQDSGYDSLSTISLLNTTCPSNSILFLSETLEYYSMSSKKKYKLEIGKYLVEETSLKSSFYHCSNEKGQVLLELLTVKTNLNSNHDWGIRILEENTCRIRSMYICSVNDPINKSIPRKSNYQIKNQNSVITQINESIQDLQSHGDFKDFIDSRKSIMKTVWEKYEFEDTNHGLQLCNGANLKVWCRKTWSIDFPNIF